MPNTAFEAEDRHLVSAESPMAREPNYSVRETAPSSIELSGQPQAESTVQIEPQDQAMVGP